MRDPIRTQQRSSVPARVLQAVPMLHDAGPTLVLYGDVR